jgi:hypothetical protein
MHEEDDDPHWAPTGVGVNKAAITSNNAPLATIK